MFNELFKQLQEMDGAQIIVGVQAEDGENFHGQTVSSDETMLKIAYVHEYGWDIKVTPKMRAFLHHMGIHLKKDTKHIHIPERSYIRRGFEEGKASFNQAMNTLIGEYFKGKITADELLEALGRQALTDTVGNMGVGTTPITAITMANRKHSASSTPLTDTGTLFNHITYRIVKKGE